MIIVASCGGSDSAGPPGTGPIEFPTDAESVVFSYSEIGGLTTEEAAFQSPPRLVVSGDGEAVMQAPAAVAVQGQLLPDMWSLTITPAGVEQLLAAARKAGLLADRDYDAPQNLADASTATVTITTTNGSWTHEAYALGLVEDDDPDRQALHMFVRSAVNVVGVVEASEVGQLQFYLPEEYLFAARPIESAGDAPVRAWPAASNVQLADASDCERRSEIEVGEVFETAAAGTLFTDGGVLYEVFAKQAWPGATC